MAKIIKIDGNGDTNVSNNKFNTPLDNGDYEVTGQNYFIGYRETKENVEQTDTEDLKKFMTTDDIVHDIDVPINVAYNKILSSYGLKNLKDRLLSYVNSSVELNMATIDVTMDTIDENTATFSLGDITYRNVLDNDNTVLTHNTTLDTNAYNNDLLEITTDNVTFTDLDANGFLDSVEATEVFKLKQSCTFKIHYEMYAEIDPDNTNFAAAEIMMGLKIHRIVDNGLNTTDTANNVGQHHNSVITDTTFVYTDPTEKHYNQSFLIETDYETMNSVGDNQLKYQYDIDIDDIDRMARYHSGDVIVQYDNVEQEYILIGFGCAAYDGDGSSATTPTVYPRLKLQFELISAEV